MLGHGLSNAAARAARSMTGYPTPTLDLSMMHGVLDSRITFTRASSGTYTDSAGVLRTQGYNLLLRSEEFDQTWAKTRASVVPNAAIAPNGALTADKLVEDATASNSHLALQSVTGTPTLVHTFSVYAKAAERSYIHLQLDSGGTAGGQVRVSLTDGTTGTPAGTGSPTVAVSNAGNGWWRIALTAIPAASGTTVRGIVYVSEPATTTYTGDGVSGIYVWGAQLETGTLSDYSATTTAANSAPRFDYDPVTLAARGLLIEEARTNSIRNSTATGAVAGIPGSGGTAPTNWAIAGTSGGLTRQIMGTGVEEGIPYIDLRIFGTDGTYGDISFDSGTIAAASGQSWAGSVYLRLMAGSFTNLASASLILYGVPNFTDNGMLSIKTITNAPLKGQRLAVTKTLADGTTTSISPRLAFTPGAGAVDITLRIGLPQLEAGAFVTSPVLTTGSATATRAADVAVIGTLTPWYNASEGAMLAEFDLIRSPPPATQYAVAFDDGTASNMMALYVDSIAQCLGFITTGLVTQAQLLGASGIGGGAVVKAAMAYKINDAALAVNGAAAVADATVTIPTVTKFNIGNRSDGARQFSGHIRRVKYFNSRLANATLQSITS